MKVTMKKSLAVLMSFVMIVSVLFGLSFASQVTASAADVNTVNYVYDGSYVYNWGERGTTATFLSPMAIEFYSTNDVTLDELLALNGSASESGVPSSALFNELHELMESNHNYITSYDKTKNLFQYTDCQNSGGKISSFYSGLGVGPTWDTSFNREHVWPNSKGDKAGSGENDLMMLRPTSTSENSSRGNKAYGTTTTTQYYNPNDESDGAYDLRGDCARIILYQYVRWECTNTGSEYNPTGIFGADGVIESKDVLLDWIEADPVDTWELGRNDSAESILGTRNVFVDYPELAFDLFNEDVPTDYTSPSGGTSVEGSTSGGDSGADDNTGAEDVVAPSTATYVFADYTAGTQYANETLALDDIVTATSYNQNCHFTTQLRMYNSNTTKSGGMVILSSKSEISSISVNAGYKATQISIYSSADGSTWSSAIPISLTTSYGDHSVDLPSGTKYIKIENTGSAQARIASMTLTFVASSGDDTTDTETVFPDTSDDVVVSGSADAFPADTTITITPITSGTDFDTADTALDGIASKFQAYDITAPSQPTTPVTITLDIPAGYDADHVRIAYIDESGEATLLDSEVNKTKNTVSALVEHFSTYAVVDTSEASTEGGEGETVEVEATINFNSGSFIETGATAQIWSENGVTVTANKGTYTGTFYTTISDHTRWYKGHEIVTEYTYPISKIVFTTTGTSYTTLLANSLTSSGLGTVTSSGTTITLELTTPSETVTFSHVNNATRVKSMTLTAQKPAEGGDTTEAVITPTVNNAAYGSVEVSGNYIIATPNEGYEVVGYEVISGTATVTQNGNNFTVEADADVTVQINFAPRTQYTATFKEMGATTSTQTAYSGDSITLPAITSDDYTVVGWVAAEIDGETTDKPTVYNAGSNYAVTDNVTFYALYSRTQAGGGGESDVFTQYEGAITEGDYLIVYDGGAMKASVTSSRLDYTEVTVSGNSITSPDASLIWTVTADGSYYTLYNESTGKYAAGTGAKNKAQLLSAVEDKARWTVSGTATYEFVNKANAAASVNANLRKNGTYGFACYATGTGGALTLYKRTAAAMTTYYFTSAGETPDYTITANANDATFGTVTVSGTTISATPNEGYTVSGYSVASGTATVVREGNTFFVTPTSNVVITINFEALPTYTVTFVESGTEVGSDSTYSGGFIQLPEYSGELDEYTTFDGWAEQENETDPAKIYAAKATFAVTKNVTLYAQFTVTAPPVVEGDHYFIKVTENQTDWTGTYLIVYEAGSIAFNGAMANKLDAVSNGVGVTMADGKIAATDANIAVSFVVEKIEGGYTIRSKSGLYFGSESDTNSLLSNATKTYFNNFAVDADGNIVITGEGGAILRYNATSGQDRFRFYKTSSYTSQQPIALYKLDVADITGAQVTIGSDLTMKYYVDVTNIENVADGDLTMRFSIDGEVIDTVTGTVVGSQYVFDFAGLAPQRMADAIKAEVLYKGTLIDVKDNYSIKTNAQNLLTENAGNAELCQFITDMLYYGAAAQKYTKYNTANLATDGITGLGTPSTATPDDAWKMSLITEDGVPSGSPYFRAATVWFDNENGIIVKVEGVTANTWIEVDGEIVAIVDGQYKLDNIKVTDFDNVYTFELYEDGYLIQTLQYSINAYAYSKQNSTNANMAELALALFRLGQSAEKL